MTRNFLTEAFELFGHIIARTSQLSLQAAAKRDDIALEPLDAGTAIAEQVQLQSRIFMADGSSGIALAYYFNIDSAIDLCARVITKGSGVNKNSLALDFMNEFNNLHSGAVRTVVQRLDIKLKTTLPMAMEVPGGDYKANANPKRTVWKLWAGDSKIIGEATVFGFNAIVLCPNQQRLVDILDQELVDISTKSTVEIFEQDQ